jgi:hypothetical protein
MFNSIDTCTYGEAEGARFAGEDRSALQRVERMLRTFAASWPHQGYANAKEKSLGNTADHAQLAARGG